MTRKEIEKAVIEGKYLHRTDDKFGNKCIILSSEIHKKEVRVKWQIFLDSGNIYEDGFEHLYPLKNYRLATPEEIKIYVK